MKKNNRLKTLEELNILDTLPEQEFDDIVELASAICGSPISLISLLDSHRQWFKAKKGITDSETPLEYSFCHHAISNPSEVMVVPDALQDIRFAGNPYVTGEPNVRFYAGAPIVTRDGYALGTLCVIDNKPRQFTAEERRMLKILADRVMRQLELRKENRRGKARVDSANRKLRATLARLLETQRTARIGTWEWKLKTNETFFSEEMFRLLGMDREEDSTLTFEKWQQLVHPDDMAGLMRAIEKGLATNLLDTVEYRVKKPDGSYTWILGRGTIVTNKNKIPVRLKGTAMDITERKLAEENKMQYTRTLEEMLHTFSHKIRKPVATSLGLIEVLNLEKLTEDNVKTYTGLLKKSAEELDSYIKEATLFLHEKSLLNKSLTTHNTGAP